MRAWRDAVLLLTLILVAFLVFGGGRCGVLMAP